MAEFMQINVGTIGKLNVIILNYDRRVLLKWICLCVSIHFLNLNPSDQLKKKKAFRKHTSNNDLGLQVTLCNYLNAAITFMQNSLKCRALQCKDPLILIYNLSKT